MATTIKRRALDVLRANPSPARWNEQFFTDVRQEDQQDGLELLVAYQEAAKAIAQNAFDLDNLRAEKVFGLDKRRIKEIAGELKEWRKTAARIKRRLRKLGVKVPVRKPGGKLVPELRWGSAR